MSSTASAAPAMMMIFVLRAAATGRSMEEVFSIMSVGRSLAQRQCHRAHSSFQ
jgi:hypothetical protein